MNEYIERLCRAAIRAKAEDHNSDPVADPIENIDQYVEKFWPFLELEVIAVLQGLIEMEWPEELAECGDKLKSVIYKQLLKDGRE